MRRAIALALVVACATACTRDNKGAGGRDDTSSPVAPVTRAPGAPGDTAPRDTATHGPTVQDTTTHAPLPRDTSRPHR